MVGDEAAVGARGVAEALADHASQHCLETLGIAVVVFPHPLERNPDAHLTAGNRDGRVEQVKVGQLAVDTIVNYVKRLEAVVESVVDHHGTL